MPLLLQTWDTLIDTRLAPSNFQDDISGEKIIHETLLYIQNEKKSVKTELIDGIIERQKVIDKEQYIQIHQAILIRMLDKLHIYRQSVEPGTPLELPYESVISEVEEVLNFMEDFFSKYFDRNENVPIRYFEIYREELRRQLIELEGIINRGVRVDVELSDIILNNFRKFCFQNLKGSTYKELFYHKDLIAELLSPKSFSSEESVREILCFFNFNDDDYVFYQFRKLQALTDPIPTAKERITALRYEQKLINQLRTRLDYALVTGMPPLKEQVNSWINEEIKFLESDALAPAAGKQSEPEFEEKINTSLSVAKLALLIRLMVIDKVITNRVVAQMLRVVVQVFSTLQRENIAYGSMETKYHNPDRGTISAVKDMLFRWINILNKL